MMFDKITEEVKKDLTLRSELGLRKYNTSLYENNLDAFLQHAYEECLDMAQYLKKQIIQREQLRQIINESESDEELAVKIRQFVK